jgi:hypothetical protein
MSAVFCAAFNASDCEKCFAKRTTSKPKTGHRCGGRGAQKIKNIFIFIYFYRLWFISLSSIFNLHPSIGIAE